MMNFKKHAATVLVFAGIILFCLTLLCAVMKSNYNRGYNAGYNKALDTVTHIMSIQVKKKDTKVTKVTFVGKKDTLSYILYY